MALSVSLHINILHRVGSDLTTMRLYIVYIIIMSSIVGITYPFQHNNWVRQQYWSYRKVHSSIVVLQGVIFECVLVNVLVDI